MAQTNTLIRYFGVVLAAKNITGNAISLRIVETNAWIHFSFMVNDNVFENATSLTRAGKLVMLDDIANAVLFLSNPNAGRIRSHVLTINNGHTLLVPK